MQSGRFLDRLRRAYVRYDKLMEKQGFYIVLGVCVLVIVLSAVYTFHFRDEWQVEDTTGVDANALAAGGNQQAQTLSEVNALIASQGAWPTTLPTEAPLRFTQPVDGFTDRDYSITEPQFFAQTGVWQVHAGIDLQVDYGTPVKACAAGKVARVWQDNEMGLCVRLSHTMGYESVYAGLSYAGYVKAGDPVSQGQTIAHTGNDVLSEADANPHLHLEIWHEGRPVDPMEAFLGIDR